jgi:hypothetical protein
MADFRHVLICFCDLPFFWAFPVELGAKIMGRPLFGLFCPGYFQHGPSGFHYTAMGRDYQRRGIF